MRLTIRTKDRKGKRATITIICDGNAYRAECDGVGTYHAKTEIRRAFDDIIIENRGGGILRLFRRLVELGKKQ